MAHKLTISNDTINIIDAAHNGFKKK
jgi:hypothetical protein